MLFILLLAALGLCFASNRDIFSPTKFYHVSLTVYFAGVFVSEQNGYTYAVYLAFILTGMVMSVMEAYTLSQRNTAWVRPGASDMMPGRFVAILWALSIIPILAQCYMIHLTGGLASIATAIIERVASSRGLGHVTIAVKLLTPINLVYYTVGLVYAKRRPGVWWLIYGLHLTLSIISAALLGGRTFILVRFLVMMMIYHYVRRPIKLQHALVAGVALVVIASFLGTVRGNITHIHSVDSLRRVKDLEGNTFSRSIFSYGIMGLDIVFLREFDDFQYGSTYLAGVTNFVPRKIWPDKFESGGVVLTKFAHGRHYTGLTNMSTGIVTESILNFGYPLGIPWAFVLLGFVVLLTVQFYAYYLHQIGQYCGLRRAYLVILYAYLARVAGSLLLAEFADMLIGLIMHIVFLSIVILFLRVRLTGAPMTTARAV